MLKITVLAVGRLKESYLREVSAEYAKRLSPLCSLKILEIEPESLPEQPKAAQISAALAREAERLSAQIPAGSFVIPLCIEGAQLESLELSQKLDALALSGKSSVCFLIGSSYGLADSMKARGDLRLSMSKMTFPHQLARVMLLEQIYRALKISSGGTYHK